MAPKGTQRRLYERRDVAAATGIPARRLEGWARQKLIEPTRTGRGKGARHKFDLGAIVKAAMLDRIQKLFGVGRLRPGGPFALGLQAWKPHDNDLEPFIDPPHLAIFWQGRGKLNIVSVLLTNSTGVRQQVESEDVVLTVNVTRLAARIREALAP